MASVQRVIMIFAWRMVMNIIITGFDVDTFSISKTEALSWAK